MAEAHDPHEHICHRHTPPKRWPCDCRWGAADAERGRGRECEPRDVLEYDRRMGGGRIEHYRRDCPFREEA